MKQEKLKELFIDRDLSQRSVAKELGCSQSTVKHFIKKFGLLKPKNKKEEITEATIKVCSKCKLEKSASDFYFRKERKNELTGYCKSCNSNDVVKRMQSTKFRLVELKGGKCQICSFSEYIGALDFHHVLPDTKDDGVSRLIRGKLNQKVIDEVNKCVLVCSNCHRMIHAGIKPCPELLIINLDV